jgi:16S rRNA A1518/A1519 N6-dimethyltransferase RsmA/KsgA/DIM1 with predicted DNA glycosylase/AP lyase activity
VELDLNLGFYLKKKFFDAKNLQIFHHDFLQYTLPNYPYKVFANIPFSIEGKIIRKLLNAPNPPEDTYLIMREDLAVRLGGIYKECQFAVFYKPWFDFKILHKFRKTDYTPFARMDTVLLRFSKKQVPLVSLEDKRRYMLFIGQGYGTGKNIKNNLSLYFSFNELQRAADTFRFSLKDPPSKLTFQQWIRLFNLYKSGKLHYSKY